MYRKFIKSTLMATISILLIFSFIIIVIDPFYHYHKPLKKMKPVVNDERYQNPGIAEHFSYDSILTGSSMTQNFRISELDKTFECDTIKLTYSAIRTGSFKYMFEKAFSTRNIKNVFMGLDIDPLLDTYGNYYFPLPEYLYDDNIFNDVNYVLNKDVMFKEAYGYLKANYKGTVQNIDDAYMWQKNFSEEDALKSVTWSLLEQGERTKMPQYLENTKKNLEKNILPYIEGHPETTFYIFFPPYSLLWWNMHVNYGDLEDVMKVLVYTSSELLKYDNVKLYSFQDIKEVITNLNIYVDYNHYNQDINSEMIKWMKEDKYRLTKDNYEDRISNLYHYVNEFDYSLWEAKRLELF